MLAAPVYRLREVTKTRAGGSARFRLRVPRLEIARGERVALVGPSGCGKSTLLDLLALVSAPDAGAAEFAFQPPQTPPANLAALWQLGRADTLAALRGRHLGYVLQTGGLLGFLSVRDNIGLPRALLGLPDDGSVAALAGRLGLERHLEQPPAALSVGERQRVAIARALVHAPSIVVADEPTASLDPVTADTVMRLFLELAAERSVTLVLASHDLALIERCGLRRLPVRVTREADGVLASFGEGE
ncbi:putative ABC transport system ATP-binding protein [Plasticicumulans lactativorans]|uniref:Putative ABC transport system ATP-binding protein n=1 Tax=Plasticicumulans lactativorans TaxID=1133106 RepID=A0A4V2SDJ2_9GAMM|nr:ABC transporter ATP-binding protein [Plasticicumulans lactativorans]TCO83695.1 putative ABC transport system ATP-binding protein [Plasticicumulans lactativorans]